MKNYNIGPPILVLLLFMLTLAVATASATAGPLTTEAIGLTTRVSVASDGAEGNDWSISPSISGDGRYVAFESRASNLVPGDTNNTCFDGDNCEDVFVHDRATGETTRVSVASDGAQGNGRSGSPSISGDGRYVAFRSNASNLVPGDTFICGGGLTYNCPEIFVHDRTTGETTRVSVASDGAQGNHMSHSPSISGDGRYVAFTSYASNLVPGDTNQCLIGIIGLYPGPCTDAFVHDRVTGETTRVSVASDGTQDNGWSGSPSISGDGRYVAFSSRASNLVPGDTNGHTDVFVHDRTTGETIRVSVASDGTQGDDRSYSPSISGDGRYVAFSSRASNLVPGENDSCETSDAKNCQDVFVHDRETGETTRVSIASDGAQGNDWSGSPSISVDGRYVAFYSYASNLVPGDTNGHTDVFVHDRMTGGTSRVSVASDGIQGNERSFLSSISGDGRYVAFSSEASNLVPGDTNGHTDVFVHDRYFTSHLPFASYLPFAARGRTGD